MKQFVVVLCLMAFCSCSRKDAPFPEDPSPPESKSEKMHSKAKSKKIKSQKNSNY